jgi:hypothetical protein
VVTHQPNLLIVRDGEISTYPSDMPDATTSDSTKKPSNPLPIYWFLGERPSPGEAPMGARNATIAG